MKNNTSEFKLDKECKHSRRYTATDKDCPIKTIYVDRKFANEKDVLWITINEEK